MKRMIMVMAMTAGLVAQALAQTAPPGAPPGVAVLVPVPVPVPPGGCVWAGRAFSEGAEFCFAPKVIMKCNSGKWNYDGLDACTNTSPIDTR